MGPVTFGLVANAAVTAGCFLLLARDAASGGIGLGAFATCAQALLGVSQLSWVLGNPEIDAEQGVAAIVPALRLDDAMADAEAALAPPTETDVDVTALPRHHVRFRDVHFRYAGRDHDVLAGLDLEIPAGSSFAIVGENGAGKTTLVKLLARLYEPTSGVIEVDGVALSAVDPFAWQRRVAAIFQDFGRYPLPVTDNIGWGAVEHAGDRTALERAARRAGALEMIEGLPFGWDSVLDRQFDKGIEVSGGQWQRIALARALFAVEGGAGILVLDEPTAQLDVRAEADIYERFLELTRGLTTIVISHRFSTVRRADRIAVIDTGRVVEQGSHDELMALGGRYAEMFRLQADRFRSGEEEVG
jgi:ATP-binding cassette subfamily B protein